ncbi:nucleic acid dioxygenase ALKBH1-like [Microplitis mediator]|uniref:nucleic acid dioxygenase ALKBH1-like n=1 Tax=Microplitis mediator TaxID=375433 RepID=UPI00255664A5|nr:nucleic acid dioxygenase ALKBH1-like [Microplitis mediator]
MFRDHFKYYKSRNPSPKFEDVIDINNSTKVRQVPAKWILKCSRVFTLGLTDVSSWKIYEFNDIPGLIFIKNPFTSAGQRHWITKCLRDYPKKPNKLNIDAHGLLEDNETWWDICTRSDDRAVGLIPKLRWATMGYHHNWDTKHYSEDLRTEMPGDLAEMSKVFAEALGFKDFNAEAAIINYYRMNSTLAGHTDHSEVDLHAPLISISFGQTAVFLIGGSKLEDPANGIFIRSGDVVIMTGQSRLNYHGVPRILADESLTWELDEGNHLNNYHDWSKAKTFINETRININVRQVLKPGQRNLCQSI